jgi:hypothetical protein
VVRTAFRLRWLPRHLLLVVIVTAMCSLGHWQWDVSQSERGSLQNTLYAFQWWAMALIVIYGWWRLLRDDAHPEKRPRAEPPPQPADDDGWAQPEPLTTGNTAAAVAVADEPDEELDAYNRYLAWLNERSERTSSTSRIARNR